MDDGAVENDLLEMEEGENSELWALVNDWCII